MNKLILLAPLIVGGVVTPVASTDISPNMLSGYSPLVLRYDTSDNEFYLSNNLINPNAITLMRVEYVEPDLGFLTIYFDYFTTFFDYIEMYAINIYLNDYKWSLIPEYTYYDDTYYYDIIYSEPLGFDSDYNYYFGLIEETGRTGVYATFEYDALNVNFTNLHISFDILDAGELATYQLGYDAGYDAGYDVGYDDGENNALVNTSFVDFIVNAVGGFMDFEIFPNFSIGGLLGAFVAVFIAVILLRVFAGG